MLLRHHRKLLVAWAAPQGWYVCLAIPVGTGVIANVSQYIAVILWGGGGASPVLWTFRFSRKMNMEILTLQVVLKTLHDDVVA